MARSERITGIYHIEVKYETPIRHMRIVIRGDEPVDG